MRVIIIGGGPSGLMCAIKLKNLLKNTVDITIYDKRDYDHRTRNQVVVLNSSTVKELPDHVTKSQYIGYVNPVSLDHSGECYDTISHGGEMSIQLKWLEKLLLNEVNSMSIPIVYKELKEIDIEQLLNVNKDTLFIGTDGFHSKIRKVLNCDTIDVNISQGVVCIFERKENSTYRTDVETIKKYYEVDVRRLLGVPQHRYRGFRSRTNYNHISLNLTKQEFELIDKSVTTVDQLPQEIQIILRSAGKFYGMDLPELNKIYTTCIPIKVFNAMMVTHMYESNLIILIGDSCNGPNYISASGCNNGVKMCRELVKIISNTHNFRDIYNMYEQRVEYILSQNISNGSIFTFSEDVVNELFTTYTDDQLNSIGHLHNFYIDELPKKEKCFLLSELFAGDNRQIDTTMYNAVMNGMVKRYEMIKNKIKTPNLSYVC